MRVLLTLLLATSLAASGCGPSGCSDVGGVNGVTVEVAKSLFVRSGLLEIEVCDDEGCATATSDVGRKEGDPVGLATTFDFDQLGRDFGPGTVEVTLDLTTTGGTIATTTREVVLERSYPNGKACDGDGYVSGSLRVDRSDRIIPAT